MPLYQPAISYKESNKAMWILLIVVLLKMIGHIFAIHPGFDLQRDEYLHLDQANHLAWGYQSVPPFTSWVSWLIKLFGNRVFWVKFFPALFGAGTIVTAYNIATTLGAGIFARSLTAVALLLSVLFRINILFQPNSFDILCWTLVYLFLVRYIQSYKTTWLIWLAIIFAIGFLNKYSILFLGLSIACALLFTPERKIFSKKQLYIAAGIALLIILPNLVWQYQQGFPVVHHMKELAETQLVHVNRGDFLKEQLLFFFQAIFILLAAFTGFIFYAPFKKYRVIFFSYIFCILFFLYFKAKAYYALGLYPVLIAFGATYLEYIFKEGRKRYFKPLCFIVVVLLFYPYVIRLPLIAPEKMMITAPFNKTGPHVWEDGIEHPISQDYADMLGWKELAHKTDSIYNSLPTAPDIVIADNYGQAGAINFYTSLSSVSFNADYMNWFDLSKPITSMILIRTAGSDDPRSGKLQLNFEKILLADSITNPLAREFGTRIYVLLHAAKPINEFLKAKLAEMNK